MPATAVITNLALYVGEDKTLQDTIFQADGTTPQNITGWSMIFVCHAYGDPTAVFFMKSTVSGSITISNAPAGVVQISVSNSDTVGLNPDQYEFTIERIDAGADGVPTKGLLTLLRK